MIGYDWLSAARGSYTNDTVLIGGSMMSLTTTHGLTA